MKINLKQEIKTSYAVAIIATVAFFAGANFVLYTKNIKFEEPEIVVATKKQHKTLPVNIAKRPKPQPVSMEKLKAQGFV